MAGSSYVEIKGIPELEAKLRSYDRGLVVGFRRSMREIAKTVAEMAQEEARSQGLVDDRPPPGGGLAKRIRGGYSRAGGYVQDSARRVSPKYPQGYPYPKVYEYGHGRQRAFIEPAIRKARPVVRARCEALLDELAARFNGI